MREFNRHFGSIPLDSRKYVVLTFISSIRSVMELKLNGEIFNKIIRFEKRYSPIIKTDLVLVEELF